MNPVDVNSSTYFDFNKQNNKKGSKIKAGDHVRIFIQKSILLKCLKEFYN